MYAHYSGERVCKVQTEKTSDKVGERRKLRDRHGEDESKNPVDRTKAPPKIPALLGRYCRQIQDFLANFDVDGFHTHVEVQDYTASLAH